jgi:hypothetical protein
VKDTVFPPKENPVVSAGNPPMPVVSMVLDVGGASEPREIDFPAKENPPPVAVDFTAGGGADAALVTPLFIQFVSYLAIPRE